MPIFKDSNQLTSLLKELWETIFEDNDVVEQIRKSNLTVFTVLHDPEASIWVGPGIVITGEEAKREAVIRLELTGDTAHDIYLKKVNLATALGTGKVKVKGPAMKLIQMVPLLKNVYREYPRLCEKYNIPT
jgi:putative sterol carrier protein